MGHLPLFPYSLIFIVSLSMSLALTPAVRKLARSRGHVAVPKDSRWHKKETALLGGVGIFGATLVTWMLNFWFTGGAWYNSSSLPLVIAGAAVFGLGLTDDLIDLPPQHKLAGEIIIASFLLFFDFRLAWTQYETFNLFLTILWLIGITNAFNLLDNMDGLAAGIAFIAGTFLFLDHYFSPNQTEAVGQVLLIASAYLGAVLGFLFYNFNPASIFMGDAGSLFLGFMLAGLTVLGSPQKVSYGSLTNLLWVMAIPILIFFIPILDTGFVSFMRKISRRRISQGGRDHSSHRLVAIGFSERKAVLVLYGLSVVSGFIALGVPRVPTGTGLVLIAFYMLFVLFFWIYLGKVKVYEGDSIFSGERSGGITPILLEITYKRRMLEVILDLILITVAYYTAYLLRFEGNPGPNLIPFLRSLPILIACQIFSFYAFGVYRGVWERTGLSDLIGYIKAISVGTVSAVVIVLFIYRFQSFSRAVFVIYLFLIVVLISLSRLSFRLLDEALKKRNQKGTPTLIYGAGIGGQMAVDEIENNKDLGLAILGFIDDNPRIQHRKIKGYTILGGINDLESIIKKHGVKEIIISFKGNGSDKKEEVQEICARLGNGVGVRKMELSIH